MYSVDDQEPYYEPRQLTQARKLLQQGERPAAMQLIRQTLRALERAFERHHSVVVSFQLDVVRFLRECNEIKQANRTLLVCKQRIEELLHPDHPFDGRLPAELGITLTGYGMFEEGREYFQRVDKLLQSQRAALKPSLRMEMALCWCECNLAMDIELPVNEYNVIVEHISDLVSNPPSSDNPTQPSMAKRLIYILSQGDEINLLLKFLELLQISDFATSDQEWITSLLTNCQRSSEVPEKREQALLFQLEYYLKTEGEIDPLLGVLSELDQLFHEQDQSERTTILAQDMLPKIRDKYGDSSVGFARYLKFIGDLAYLCSDYHAAIDSFQKTLQILENYKESEAKELQRECYHNLGTCYVALEEYRSAHRSYRTALSFRKDKLCSIHLICESVLAVVLLLRIQNKTEKAKRYIQAFQNQYGHSPELAETLSWRRLQGIDRELHPKKRKKPHRSLSNQETTIIQEDRLDLDSEPRKETMADGVTTTAQLYATGLQHLEKREYRKAIINFERLIEIMRASSTITNREIRPVVEMLVVGYQGLGDSSKANELRSLRDSLSA